MPELEKGFRYSRIAIPVCALMLIVLLALWILASRFVTVPIWLTVIVFGATGFTLLGDIVNYVYCSRRLRAIEQNRGHVPIHQAVDPGSSTACRSRTHQGTSSFAK
jgi:hypothetical protein